MFNDNFLDWLGLQEIVYILSLSSRQEKSRTFFNGFMLDVNNRQVFLPKFLKNCFYLANGSRRFRQFHLATREIVILDIDD
jgi:hypothetical protein